MILVDTSVWIDHLRTTDPTIDRLVESFELAMHPFVLGELVLGSIASRLETIEAWRELPMAKVLHPEDVIDLVEQRRLFSRGIGFTDANLIASALTTSGLKIWTRDKRLAAVAAELGVAARFDH